MLRISSLSLIAILFISFFLHKERNWEFHTFSGTEYTCKYATWKGRVDGWYTSFYLNGKKKSEGFFADNYRKGIWTLWDSTGKEIMKREYKSPFHFKQLFPDGSNDSSSVPYSIIKNEKGYIDYFPLNEKQIAWAKRVWRFVEPKDNELLFENNRLLKLIQDKIDSRKLKCYTTDNDEFRTEMETYFLDTNIFKVIGFKTKEDCFYEMERQVSETRVIGICPVAINKLKKDTIDLYWVYYPDTRQYLATVKVGEYDNPKIKSLDDVFFFRCFSGQIYKESNIYNRTIASYAKTPMEQKKESVRIELEILETEHELWMNAKH